MKFEYTILPEERLVLVRLEGPFFLTELTDSAAIICADVRYRRDYDGLIDLTSVEVTISPREIKDLITYTLSRQRPGVGRWAVLVTTPIATAFAMLYQNGLTARHHMSLFCTLEGASQFLDRTITRRFFDGIPVTTLPKHKLSKASHALQA